MDLKLSSDEKRFLKSKYKKNGLAEIKNKIRTLNKEEKEKKEKLKI